MREFISGNEAVARGAYEAGCRVACAYPGTPSSEILENIAKYKDKIYCEWSTNEKVAMEVTSGAVFAGARSLVAMKHVGLNVAADPLFSMAYIGATGGFVIVSADDPGMHSSQNEQDNRNYARAAKIAMLEPSDSEEARLLTKLGFDISEQFDTPVLLRLTTRISHSYGIVNTEKREEHPPKTYNKDIKKRLILPAHARVRHIFVEERLEKLREYSNGFFLNKIEWGDKDVGIITSGISYQYVKEVFPEASVLKLSLTWPLPDKLIREFANNVKEVIVVEENDPFLESEIRAMGIKVVGKEKVPLTGELDPYILKRAFGFSEEIHSTRSIPSRPPVLCAGCSHRGVFYCISKLKLTATGDIGCYTLGALPPLNALDTCVCMGASIGNSFGLELALGDEIRDRLVAVIGDSTFFHSGITGLIDIVYNRGTSTVIILDNFTTAMTGHQEHPGTGKTLMGEGTRKIALEDIARACGVENVYVVDPYNLKETEEVIKREVKRREPSVIIARRPCALRVKPEPPLRVIPEKCTGCKLCLRLGCPAISMKDDKAVIDKYLCNGCGMCKQVCLKDAIVNE
ncbi:indolepyruvate ferredoxin oxidoreductase subunit alpha [candidate division WOR-3 bacterium JGI_Cruoil_03_44_89]|uniref:Indolepyruvate oxidoreductase subunit IorA n=1 Tax=candidate division WOR-3 bacterium JGI_Cruoil_03_44_89 TaxID=1973748 RepID=A0A235BP72_UNCW3|nr:MAG: indolepyruvate ferredoxin oxidoreductase subunit alpha [candidate division WOR-3 bacterium JGI_Cruoil_03_44_89]